MTVQDLYRVLVDSQFIEIYKPNKGEELKIFPLAILKVILLR